MYDVITMGSNVVDAFAIADSELIDIKTKEGEEELIAYPLGSKIPLRELRYDVGGNGVNSAVGMSRLGLNVGYLGKIGSDRNGELILDKLKKENISFLGTRGLRSGFSVVLYSELGEDRTILTYRGCNSELKADEIDLGNLNSKWFYFSSLLNDSFKTMELVASHAKDKGAKIAFNPSSTISKKGLDFLRNIIEKTDLLIVNDQEAEDLVGKGTSEENLMKLFHLGIPMVVITLGKKGLIATDGQQTYNVSPHPCKVIEKTGAGDACSSGIISGLIQGKSFEECLRMGMINAESVLQHYGAQNKLLNNEELQGLLENDKREIDCKKI